jgi:uncharacterized protein Usg
MLFSYKALQFPSFSLFLKYWKKSYDGVGHKLHDPALTYPNKIYQEIFNRSKI